MSDNKQPPDPPTEPVRITLELPAGLVRSYDGLVAVGIYPNRESTLVHAIVESWRHNRGSFQTLRIDLDRGETPQGEATRAEAERARQLSSPGESSSPASAGPPARHPGRRSQRDAAQEQRVDPGRSG